MSKHNYTARIIIRKDFIKQDGTSALALQVFINKKRKVISLGVSVEPSRFNRKKQQVKGNEKLNAILHHARSRAQDIFYQAILTDTVLTRERFSELYENEALNWNFLIWMEREIEKSKDERATGTIKSYYKCLNRLKEFRKSISFSEIDLALIRDYNRFLKRKKYDINTVYAYHKNLKKFINLAISQKINIENPYQHFKIKSVHTQRVFLLPEETKQILALYESGDLPEHLMKVVRQFLFMCFTGLRMSDCRAASEEWIVGTFLVFRPVKTRNSKMIHRVPLNTWAQKMIKDGKGKNGKIFDCYMDEDYQQFNRHLLYIGQQIGIDKKVTSHVGRHTFATTFLRLGGKVEVLQRILGHTRIDATMIYVHIVNEQMKEQVDLFDDFF